MKKQKKFISDVDLNKSSSACSPCKTECEKINKRVNKRKLEKTVIIGIATVSETINELKYQKLNFIL